MKNFKFSIVGLLALGLAQPFIFPSNAMALIMGSGTPTIKKNICYKVKVNHKYVVKCTKKTVNPKHNNLKRKWK